jgi:hypothetical protein
MALTSTLDAVNTIIGVIGEAPLNTLDNKALTSDATVASRLLDEVSKQVQTLGWSFNTDYDFTFARDVNNNIFVPDNVLRVKFDPSCSPDLVLIGRQMYDRKGKTYVFTKDVKVQKVVWLRDWDDIPESGRSYITIRAARIFADRQGGGQEVHGYTAMQEVEAKRTFEQDESEVRHLNIFQADGVSRTLNRRAPWAW